MTDRAALPAGFEPFVDDPTNAGIFCDFDGTLAAIVPTPADARPLAGVVDNLEALAGWCGRVAVISGRPVGFVAGFLPPSVWAAGLYGLETRYGGAVQAHPQSGSWRQVIDDVAAASAAHGPHGMRVESKGLSITLHYRGEPEIAPDVAAWAEQQGARSGLLVRPARMAYELHPPIHIDKGTTLLELATGLRAACFFGDDIGDLTAFTALDTLEAQGVAVVRVAVRSAEESAALIDHADVVVDGPEGAAALLATLRAAIDRS